MILNNHVFVKKEGAILLLRNHLSTFRLKLSIFYPLGLTFASLKVYDRVPKRLILVLSNALLVGVVLLTYFVPTKITFGMLVGTVGSGFPDDPVQNLLTFLIGRTQSIDPGYRILFCDN